MPAKHLPRVIAERVALARARAELTQAELAELAGVTDETISRMERGKYEPAISTLVNVSRALGVSVDYLVGLDDHQPETRYVARSDAARLAEQASSLEPATARALLNLVRALPRQEPSPPATERRGRKR